MFFEGLLKKTRRLQRRSKSSKIEVNKFAKKKDLDLVSPKRKEYVYFPNNPEEGNLDPYNISEEFLTDLLGEFGGWVSSGNSNNRYAALLEAAKQLVVDRKTFTGKEIGQLKQGLSKPGIVYLAR
jgi:hypothetical protein